MQLPPPIHGVTVVNARIATSAILAERFELDVLPLRFSDEVRDLGRISARKLGIAARTAWQLVRRLRMRPDGVYLTLAVQRPALYRDLVLLAMIRAAGIPVVVHLHAIPDHRAARWLRGATLVLTSPLASNGLEGRYVPNGVPALPRVAHGDEPRVLFFAHLIRAKGPLVLVEALRLAGMRATFGGTHTGEVDVPDHSSASREVLFASHDVYVHPTLADAFPLTILEAMSAGMAIVASAVGAIPEILDGVGLLVPPGDPRALANALVTLKDRALRERFGNAARARYLERYTAERFETALADAISSALVAQRG